MIVIIGNVQLRQIFFAAALIVASGILSACATSSDMNSQQEIIAPSSAHSIATEESRLPIPTIKPRATPQPTGTTNKKPTITYGNERTEDALEVGADDDIFYFEPYEVKETYGTISAKTHRIQQEKDASTWTSIQTKTYAIRQENDNSIYVLEVIDVPLRQYIQIYDENSVLLQNIVIAGYLSRLKDVNFDGYLDIIVDTWDILERGNIVHDWYDLYIWDSASQNFIKVLYEGFYRLYDYTLHEDYMEGSIEGDRPEDNFEHKLVWNGYTLIAEENEPCDEISELRTYDDLIKEWAFEWTNHINRIEMEKELFSFQFYAYSGSTTAYYALYDIDKNGVNELLLKRYNGGEDIIAYIFTLTRLSIT